MISHCRAILSAAALAALSVFASAASAATVALHSTAVDIALKKKLFTHEDKYFLAGSPRDCTYAYLDMPQTSFRRGRMFLQVHFTARTGQAAGDHCVGPQQAFTVVMSARPYFDNAVLGLTDFHVEQGDQTYSPLLEALVIYAIPIAFHLDLRQEVARMLQGSTAPYTVTVPSITVQSMSAEDDVLKVDLDFVVDAR
jgi:hypothetical protein